MHGKGTFKAILCGALVASTLGLSLAQAAERLAVPSGIDFRRLKMIEKGEKRLKVYVEMIGISDRGEDVKLLINKRAGDSVGTADQMRDKFSNAISKTERFIVLTDKIKDIRDDDDAILVQGRIVTAMQDVEDWTAAKKAITTVKLSLNVINPTTSQKEFARTIMGIYGTEPGEGTIVKAERDLKSSYIQESLKNDFERALTEALTNVAATVERRYRPMAKVIDVDGSDLALTGGSEQGLNPNDKLVVFRGKMLKVNGKDEPGIMKAVALVECPSVGTESSTCRIVQKGENGDPKPGDYAVVADDSMRLKLQ